MVKFNTHAAQLLSETIVKSEHAAKSFVIDAVNKLNEVPVSNYIKLQDLAMLVRHCIHPAEKVLQVNDLGPLKSVNVYLSDYTIEIAGIFNKTMHLTVRMHNSGPEWKINAKNWEHLTTALSQTCPKYLG